jgi:hypothetical protein
MVAEGTLAENRPPKKRGGRGRKPSRAFALTKSAKAELESRLADSEAAGTWAVGQQMVSVSFDGEDLLEVMEAIGDLGDAARPTWTGLLDGSRQKRAFFFGGEDALARAQDFMVTLAARQIEHERFTVSEISTGRQFAKDAHRRIDIANDTLRRRASRNPPW